MAIHPLGDPREKEIQSLIRRREEALSQIKQYDHESPRVPWRLVGLSQATMSACSASCL